MATPFQVKELTEDQSEVWSRLLSGSPQATVFCTHEFSDALKEATGRAYKFLVCYRGDRLVAGMPLFEWKRAGILMIHTPPLVPYLGLIISTDIVAGHIRSREYNVFRACKAFSDWMAKEYDHIVLSHHPSLTDLRPLVSQGFREKLCYTHRIRLPSFGLNTLHPNTRNKIAKAGRENVQIEESRDLTDIFALVEMSYARRGRAPPFSREYLKTLFGRLAKRGVAKLFYARDSDGQVISGRIALESFNVMYDWVAGADPDRYGSGATSLLLFTVINRSKTGHDVFDLMGANTPSIASYKSNFGGDLVSYCLTSRTVTVKGGLVLRSREILGRLREARGRFLAGKREQPN